MDLSRKQTMQFEPVVRHVEHTYQQVVCSGAAMMVIHNDAIAAEKYWGRHSLEPDSREIQADTQFHVASVRKSYIGYAVAYAVVARAIRSIDDPVTDYLTHVDAKVMTGTTIRHLLTHTHGLNGTYTGEIIREFPPGQGWSYRGVGIDMLADIVKRTTGKTIAQIVSEQIFAPLGFAETGWRAAMNEKMAEVIREPNHPSWYTSTSTEGDKMNLYVSARELAFWGYVHLKKGLVAGRQIVPKEIIEMATSLQSPPLQDKDLPQNGFLWFVKDLPARKTEIGERVPKGSYQILGYTGVTLLVVPSRDLVAVRMFNSFGSPPGYDYLADVRGFGDRVMGCVP
ncbi:serine hydrolase domain-containing protein [Brevibacillus brevis]|uniref:Serine hydrolase domain-containing protein n=1 Tax=Brevibacillus brevis TaxID=1393 RepID=A0ABY9SXA2_BREBE|nr:serine hydrolase domain-containing protein [Brevibacillus brevis]WNC12229.1 serine hydrolase domain-containing protein [Brevibacillus brevis]